MVVTGGSSGIGLATAHAFGELGAVTSLIARDPGRLESAREELLAQGVEADARSADVSDREASHTAIGDLVASHGPCDVLVTSAGVAHPGYFEDISHETHRSEMDVNYFGTLNAIHAVVPSMIDRRRGSIVGISSAAGLLGVYGYTTYAPTKFAVRGLLETLRAELVPHGVGVHCAFPADIDTPGLALENEMKPAETAAISGMIEPGRPERVAEAIVDAIGGRRFAIYTDTQTRLLASISGLAPGILYRIMDGRVRKTRRGSTEPS